MDQKTIKDIQTKLLEDLIELQFPGQLMVGDIWVTFSDDIVENIIQEQKIIFGLIIKVKIL